MSEATDELTVIRFDSSGARVDRKRSIGVMPADIDGPHGVAISPDGRFYYITFGHGTPYGSLWKYDAATDSALGHVILGSFPASVSLTPDGAFAYVANFNLHGGMAASSVSIVATEAMLEVGRVTTCMMPHGSRVDRPGERHFSVCMMDNTLVEINARTLEKSRTLDLGPACAPTGSEPSGGSVWVACNGSSELLDVDRIGWNVRRRIPAGKGIYAIAATNNGSRIVATNKREQSVMLFDATSGRAVARIATQRRVVHGVALSPDDRYAFVSVEGVGSEPGTVEVIDLSRLTRVASVDVGAQAAGIAVLGAPSMAERRDTLAVAFAAQAEATATRFAANRALRAVLDSALALSDSALRRDSALVRAYVARGIAFAAAGRPRDAAVAYRRALAIDADYPRAANAALGQFWRAGFYDEAYRWSKRQAEREPNNLSVLFNYNVAAAFLIEPARAESVMVRALEIDPRFATAHGELAFLAQYAGRQADAARHMEAALALDSASALNRGGLAQMLVPMGQSDRARRLLDSIVVRDSTATAYGGRSVLAIYGWALKESGDTARAREMFDRALRRLQARERSGETTYQLFRELAAVHALRGDRVEAIAALAKAADAGLHTYASWELSDPMLASLRNDPGVEMMVERMRQDTRRMRLRAGLR